jgi:hypothetical protein
MSTYQLNSIIFDILTEFSADYENVDENTYMMDLTKYINYYCLSRFSETEAAVVLGETYRDPMDALFRKYKELCQYDLTAHQWLQIILMSRLVDQYNIEIVHNYIAHSE